MAGKVPAVEADAVARLVLIQYFNGMTAIETTVIGVVSKEETSFASDVASVTVISRLPAPAARKCL